MFKKLTDALGIVSNKIGDLIKENKHYIFELQFLKGSSDEFLASLHIKR